MGSPDILCASLAEGPERMPGLGSWADPLGSARKNQPQFAQCLQRGSTSSARNPGRGAGSVGPAAASHEAQGALDQGKAAPKERGARARPQACPARCPAAGPSPAVDRGGRAPAHPPRPRLWLLARAGARLSAVFAFVFLPI